MKHRQMRKIRVKGKKVKNRSRYFNRCKILPLANDTSDINDIDDNNVKGTYSKVHNAMTVMKDHTENGEDETLDNCMTPGVNIKRSKVKLFQM